MEELQDALEDAQYVNAINLDEGPRPITAWENPPEELLEDLKSDLRKKWTKQKSDSENKRNLEPFTFEWVIASSLGFFLFSAHIKESSEEHARICFIEEVLRWRYLKGRSRGYKLKRIYKRFLCPCAVDPDTNEPKIPPVTHIDECDLEYIPNGEKLSTEELNQLIEDEVDETCSKCCIGIDGTLRNDLLKTLEELVSTGSTIFTEGYTVDDFSMRSSLSSLDGENFHSFAETAPATPPQYESGETNDEGEPVQIRISQDDNLLGTTDPSFIVRALRSRALCKAPGHLFDKLEQVIVECIRRKHWMSFKKSTDYVKLINYEWHRQQKVTDEDFFLMRVLGRGGFGLVTACKKGTTGTLYAMKVMNKKRIKAKKSERLALNERACLAAVDSPFVVNLKYSFQTKDDLYLILDLMTGGDLSFHLSQKGRFPKEECLYYAARIMLGLQALHDKNYVYRDLKPENLLLAEDGRVRITDLGLATKVTSRLHGAAGTRGYWAPEMLRRNERGKRMKYDQKVDWFSYGCVVAEMICGCNPFRSETALKFGMKRTETKEKALDYATLHMEPSFESKKFTKTSTDLCKRLLDKNPETRLGSSGSDEIMVHPWFKDINWEGIMSDREKPPFVPLKDINAPCQSEIGTFTEDRNSPKLTDEDQAVYKDWDWTSPKVFSAEVVDMLIYERRTGKSLVPLSVSGSCCCSLM